ncbi:MAG: VWA domain-containing protein [Chitinispirillaceae bacterium]|nr:VWA domain-containing protein [Chitinispirillaceae bacterium]
MHGSSSQTLRKTTALTIAVVLMSFTASTLTAQVGTRVGNFMYRGNASDLRDDTIDVSDSMTAISSTFWSDISRDTTITNGEPPSIMFVIDNSGSMYGYGGNSDPNGYRFSVTRSFLDTIYSKFSNAEVGLAVFATHLSFDPADSTASGRYPFISKYPFKMPLPQYQHDTGSVTGAYVPLLKLDSVYTNYGGLTGLQLLDTILVISNTTYPRPVNHRGLRYVPTARSLRDSVNYSTNITAGFDAVKSAMTSAKASPCSRYVVFLSDGLGNRPDGTNPPQDAGTARGRTRYFMDSTQLVPTTFSVFFPVTATLGNNLGLREIDTMTTRIRVNGYDTTSGIADTAKCTYRSFYTPGDPTNLWTNFQTIWDIIRLPNRVTPTLITINGQLSTERLGDTGFLFDNYIPLTGQITPVNLTQVYEIFQNNVKIKDSVVSLNYAVRTMPHATPAWYPVKSNFNTWTWDRDHVFRYNSAVIPNIIETMDSVELYFTFDSGSAHYGYGQVYIDLYNKLAPIDSQSIQLSRVSANVFSGKFKRQVSAAANRGEVPPVLQYRGNTDSVIAVFRNREDLTSGKVRLPLDTLRKAIGFVGVNLAMAVADTTITAGDTTLPLRPAVNYSTGGAVPDTWVIPRLTWTQLPTVGTNDRIVATTGQYSRFTATAADMTTPRQIRIILTNPANGESDTVIKNIYVQHAPASRLWIEADNTPHPYTPNPLNTMVFRSSDLTDNAWAVVRDRFNNLVGFSTNTQWASWDNTVATVTNGTTAQGEGVVTKGSVSMDTTWVTARDVATTLRDTMQVIVTDVAYDSVRILRNIAGALTPIFDLYDTIPDTVTLYVRAHRVDGLGGNNGWVDVQGNWSISVTGRTSTFPPTNSNSWSFSPIDTAGHATIEVTIPGVSEMGLLDPVVFIAGPPNVMYIYPATDTPNIAGNMPWPAAPATADTMSADSSYSLLYAKLFYRTVLGKEIWLSQYETNYTLANQIRWSANGPRDTVTPDYSNHTTLVSRQARRVTTVTATWNALSYSMNIYVEPGSPHHIVIEATPTVQNLVADDPLATLPIGPTATSASAYARVRDRWGNFMGASVNSQWSSTSTAVFTAVKGDSALGEGRAVRVMAGTASMIASDAVAWPGVTMRDTVQVVVFDITYLAVRIYVQTPSYDPYIDTVTIATDDSLTLYAEGQRSDDMTWEPVDVYWGKDVSLITASTLPTQQTNSWTVVPATIGSGRIWISRNEGTYTVSDTVRALFIEGDPESVALYRSLGDPDVVPVFPAVDTVAAGSTDSVFAKVFDRNGEWLRRYEDSVALAQATISWAIRRVSGPGTDTALSAWTGRRTAFSPQTAFTTYEVTATFTKGSIVFDASAMIYVRPGTPDHLVIEGYIGPAVESSVDDNPLGLVSLGPYDTTYTNVYAIIRDQFGNFCGYSQNSDWWSGDIAVVTADAGTQTDKGQGRIDRVTTGTGSAFVMVRDLDNSSLLIDSVSVALTSVPYDSLRITLRDPASFLDTVQIPGIYTMRSGDTTAFYVQAQLAVVNTWVDVQASSWQYIASLGSKTGPANSHGWNFGADDTAHYGTITATLGTLSASVTIEITAGDPASLVIYTDSLPPLTAGNAPKTDPPQSIKVAAGARDTNTMAALIFDNNGVFLSRYLGGSEGLAISWTATSRTFGDNLNARLLGAPGPVKYFSPTRAYDTVLVVASLAFGGVTMRDTVLYVVQTGTILHMVLEKTQFYNRYAPDYCDTITILETEQSGRAFGILRDQFNNAADPFYAYATLTGAAVEWSLHDSIGVNTPLSSFGEVRALRLGLSDTGLISAWDSHNADSCIVRIIRYYYDRLRIVDAGGTPYADGFTLTMTNNDSAVIYVQGRRSDDTTAWEDIQATWEIQPVIQPVLPPGRYGHSFMVSPTDTGRGWIRVTLGDDGASPPDTLSLRFTPGAAVRATFTLLTPSAQRIAGQPLTAVDSLFDADNHLLRTPSLVVNPAAYHDTIGRGSTARPQPFMLVPGSTDTIWLDQSPWDAASQTFTGGVSTVTFRLYYAPASPVSADSMHRISTALTTGGTTLYASTVPFVLLPASLDSVVMEMNGAAIAEWDTVKIFYDSAQSSANLFSRGYDEFGNNLGFVPTDWSVTDSLHQFPTTGGSIDSAASVFYSTSDPAFSGRDEGGWMISRDPTDPAIVDSQFVFIFGPLIRLDSAVTCDTSGNGFLDRMTLYFSRPFTIPSGGTLDGLNISNAAPGHNYTFTVDAILNTGADSRVWVVTMREDTTIRDPQTWWTPEVTIERQQNTEGRYIVDDTTIKSFDGAGPVIWTVDEYRYANLLNDRSRDTVIVTFSEPVKRSGTFDDLQHNDHPGDYFFVWAIDTAGAAGSYLAQDNLLDGIEALHQPPDYTTPNITRVKFLMANGPDWHTAQDLNGNHYLNIDTLMDFIVDAVTGRYNAPNDNNRKVRVDVHGEDGPAAAIPNPATPGDRYEEPGEFNVEHNPLAVGWADPVSGCGTAIRIDFPNPDPGVCVWLQMTIYDMVGNGVQSGLTNDLLADMAGRDEQANTTGLVTADIYWNGYNAAGMMVAPGVYRVVAYIDYRDAIEGSGLSLKFPDKRKVVKVGIKSR